MEKILEFIREKFGKQINGELSEETPLLSSGIVDSFGFLELFDFIEKEFGISINPDEVDFEDFDTPAKIADYIESKQQN